MYKIKILAAALLMFAAASAGSQVGASDPTAVALTADDVNAWLDGYLPYALHKGISLAPSSLWLKTGKSSPNGVTVIRTSPSVRR